MTEGHLRKMNVAFGDPIGYDLLMGEHVVPMNQFLGSNLRFEFEGMISCCKCGKRTKNSFGEGFCYPCFQSAPEASPCIIRPELCKAHLGEGRDVDWEHQNHNQPHSVYLAVSDVVKVGITRSSNLKNRWIDQGASYGICLAETPNRYEAGVIEVALKSEFTDRTNWRKMLTNLVDHALDLEEVKWELHDRLPSDLQKFFSSNDEVTALKYPVEIFPERVESVSLDKTPVIEGKLSGIKGQYLIFDGGRVFNVRKHTSYYCKFFS